MKSPAIVRDVEGDPDGLVRTIDGATGHALFGPYVLKTQGVYQVDFQLALAQPNDADVACATLEVVSDEGTRCIVDRVLRTSDLGPELRVFSLLFVLREIKRLEFRVLVTGVADLLIHPEPRLTRIAAILDEAPRDDLGEMARDLDGFARDTRRILAMLRPRALRDHAKVRLGRDADGGYNGPDDFDGYDTALSFGINDDISWDLDAAARGLTIYQFDHTVSDPAPEDPRMIFEAKRIDRTSGPDSQSLADLIARLDAGRTRPNLVLKMDIEGDEWNVIDATPVAALRRIGWIVCELHYFQGLAEGPHREKVDRCLAKLAEIFAVVHVHSNVWGGYSNLGNTVVPNVMEVTFANRAVYATEPSDEMFPSALDQSCDPGQPDFHLGHFAF